MHIIDAIVEWINARSNETEHAQDARACGYLSDEVWDLGILVAQHGYDRDGLERMILADLTRAARKGGGKS